MESRPQRFYTAGLVLLLLACIVRFWLFLLSESFWIDETVTAFVLRYGAGHPSLAAGPRLDQTIYYWLPRVSQAVFGYSEFSLRLPSLVVTLVSLYLIWRLAARFVHPQAGWVAVFLCFVPHEFTRQATDARPYGMGTCVALSAMWFLVRWLDEGRWRDALFFAVFAALLLRVHLIYWPFYAVFAAYAILRRVQRETAISGRIIGGVFAVVTASLVPLVPVTMALFRNAKVHVVTEMPTLKIALSGFQIPMIAAAGVGLWLVGRMLRWPREQFLISPTGMALLLSWWLWQPLCLLAVSWATGNSVFLTRYFSLALPGAILMATLAAGYWIPARGWKPMAVALTLGILVAGAWKTPFPPSRNSRWREAAAAVNGLVRDSGTPVICPSPFIEAQPPVWTQGYALPGFLYAHLAAYPVVGSPILLPARRSPEAEMYATAMIRERVLPAGRLVVYGGVYGVNLWVNWLSEQSELAGWRRRSVGAFGDVEALLYERGNPITH